MSAESLTAAFDDSGPAPPWPDVPDRHGPRTTLYNRFVRLLAAESGIACSRRVGGLRRRYRHDRLVQRAGAPARRYRQKGGPATAGMVEWDAAERLDQKDPHARRRV